MATAIAQGWYLTDGAIPGTDIDLNTTTFLSGETSAVFLSTQTTAAAALVSDWIPIDDWNTDARFGDSKFEVYVVLAADQSDANDKVQVELETATADKTTVAQTEIYIGEADYYGGGNFGIVGRSRVTVPTTARWARIRISRPSNIDFNLYIDKAYLNPSPVFAQAYDDVASGHAFTNAWATANILPANGIYNRTEDAGSNTVNLYTPGEYLFTAQVLLDESVDDGDIFGIRIAAQMVGVGTTYIYGTSLSMGAANTHSATNQLALNASGVVKMDAAYSLAGGFTVIYPGGAWVEVIQMAGTLKTYDSARLTVHRIPGE